MAMRLPFYTDPGHGWLRVTRTLVDHLGCAQQITPYSYQRGRYVYLEEDCDAPLVLRALKEQGVTDVQLVYREHPHRSTVRSYARYAP